MNRKKMDPETAMAFARDLFERLHPRNTWPVWLFRCIVLYWRKNNAGNYMVGMSLTPKLSREAFPLFEAQVDQNTGETTAIVDHDLASLKGEDYLGIGPTPP